MTYIIIYYQVHNRVVALIANVHTCTYVYEAATDIHDLWTMRVTCTYMCVQYAYVFRYIITNSAHLYRALCLNIYHVNRTFAQKW